MAEPDVMFTNVGCTNVNECKIYIGVYRYPPSYTTSPILQLNVLACFRYGDICIDDRHM